MWVQARNRSTGATETMGLWTGEEDRDFSIEGGRTKPLRGIGTCGWRSVANSASLFV
jgi:hypothetical protein